ncbi:MAG: O-antigen ligase family protein [Pirellulales bacterium]|nr:O-antigen ligase family protein [Pirellulales bacterium]
MSPTVLTARTDAPEPDGRRADPWIVTTLFSFETLFVLFLMAGRFKADPRFERLAEWLSIDLTALFFGLSVLAGGVVVLRRGYRFPRSAPVVLVCAGLFFSYAVLSLLWTPGGDYARSKALYVGVLTFWTLAACAVVIASGRRRVVRFFLLLTLFAVWLAAESLWSFRETEAGHSIEALGGNYLGLGRMIGAAGLILLGYGLLLADSRAKRWAALAGFLGFCGVLLILGGRMPLLATVAGAVVPLGMAIVSQPGRRVRRRMATYALLLGVLLVGGIALSFSEWAPQTLQRMQRLWEGELGHSTASRLEAYPAGIEYWWQRPLLGHGIGAWPMLYLHSDVRAYPHNLIIETLAELGLVGLGLLIALFWAAWRALGPVRQLTSDPLRLIVLMLLVNALANAMTSGDLPDNRFLFGMLGLTCLPGRRRGCIVQTEREQDDAPAE